VVDVEEPDLPTLIERVEGVTGCKDKGVITKMAKTVKEIAHKCRAAMITDGCCGTRELIAWVQSYMVMGSIQDSAMHTVLSSASSDAENRREIEETCLLPMYAA